MILFLDFDGVLHLDAVYLTRNGPMLRGEGELFMWAGLLEEVVADLPNVSIVLSTSWVRHLGFSKAKKRLPQELRQRVTGSTWHSSMEKQMSEMVWWDQATRHAQISRFLARSRDSERQRPPTRWSMKRISPRSKLGWVMPTSAQPRSTIGERTGLRTHRPTR